MCVLIWWRGGLLPHGLLKSALLLLMLSILATAGAILGIDAEDTIGALRAFSRALGGNSPDPNLATLWRDLVHTLYIPTSTSLHIQTRTFHF